MKKLIGVCALLSIFASSTALADDHAMFDNIAAFGDSLSDLGNVYPHDHFTTPGGYVWLYYLGQRLGINLLPSNAGGSDFAIAGSITGNNLPYTPPVDTPTVMEQVTNYITANHGHLDSDTLYSIIAGANDILNGITYLEGGGSAELLIADSTQNILDMVTMLHNAGAHFIIVGNLPDIGDTPYGNPFANALTPLSQAYNAQLLSRLNATGYNIIQIDMFNLLNALVDNYKKFGFIGPLNYYGDGSGGTVNQYIFAGDGFHPSAESHLIYAEDVLATLTGPMYAAILAHAPFAVVDGQNEAIRSQLSPLEHCYSNLPIGKFSSFATGNYTVHHVDPASNDQLQVGYHGDSPTFTVGGTYRFNENGIVGVAIGRSMGDINYAHDAGGFDLDENLVTLFSGYYWNHWYSNAELTYGNIDYSNIKRNFMLGIVPETVTAQTTGEHYAAGGLLGYNFDLWYNRLQTGPVATLDWQRVVVKPYAETSSHFVQTPNGGAFDALQYQRQEDDSLMGGLGWQINWQTEVRNAAVTPYLQATYEHPFDSPNGEKVYAGVTTLPGSKFYMPVNSPDNDFGLISAGVQTVFNNGLLLNLSYSTMVGEPEQTTQNFMISASLPI